MKITENVKCAYGSTLKNFKNILRKSISTFVIDKSGKGLIFLHTDYNRCIGMRPEPTKSQQFSIC